MVIYILNIFLIYFKTSQLMIINGLRIHNKRTLQNKPPSEIPNFNYTYNITSSITFFSSRHLFFY